MRATYAIVPEENIVQLEQEELDSAVLAPHELLVEAEVSVISAGTELAIFTGLAPGVHVPGNWNAYPWRPGYGLVGKIRAKGTHTEHFTIGDRVFCFGKHASLQVYNASAESPKLSAFPVDQGLPIDTAVMLRMALVALGGLQVTQVEVGDTVAVFGLGVIGNLACQLFQIAGARVIGIDPVSSRCELARRVGIATVICASPTEQIEAFKSVVPTGATIAIDAVGDTSVLKNCAEVCSPFGQIVLLGSPRRPYHEDSTPCFRAIHNKWLTMRGALEWRIPAYPREDTKHSIDSNLRLLFDLAKDNKLHLAPLITHKIHPQAIAEAYTGLLTQKDSYIGVVIDWTLV